jgi:hypothetical protein
MLPRRAYLFAIASTLGVLTHPLPAAAWEFSWGSGPTITGSGQTVEQVRTPGSFQKLRLDGAFDVTVQPGASSRLVIKADDNLLPLIQTELDGDTLVIKGRKGSSFRTRSPITVSIDFTQLVEIALQGSGNLKATGLQGKRFELSLAGSGNAVLNQIDVGHFEASLAGSGNMTLAGRADKTELSIAGSGDIRADQLISRRTEVSIAGSGNAQVHASERLDASVAGSGDVRYAGQPAQLDRSVLGSGTVRPM